MLSTFKWIGAGLSGMACGTMALTESVGAAEWTGQGISLLQLTSWFLFPGLALLFLGLIGGGKTRSHQAQGSHPRQSSSPSGSSPADFTVKFYRAVSLHKEA